MRTLSDAAQPGVIANTRVLFLPAAYTGPDDFVQAGFVQAVRERGLPLDLVFADINLQHLTDGTILRRVRHELVLPARAGLRIHLDLRHLAGGLHRVGVRRAVFLGSGWVVSAGTLSRQPHDHR